MSAVDHKRVMGKRDITLFCISAILLLDTLAAGAAIGPSSIFWWVFLGVIFFVPFSLITAELGCSYPDQGGVYAWVKRAYGQRWASRITWAYWVNVAVWCPSIFILFAGIFSQIFWPDMTLTMQIIVGIGLTWLAVGANIITLELGKWVPNVGAIIKVMVFLAIIGGAISYSQTHETANDLSFDSMIPNLGDGFKYITVIIYGMLGFELVSAGSDEVQNPQKNVPQGIMISGSIIILLYILATYAILTAIPASDINLVEGLVDTLTLFLGGTTLGNVLVTVLSIGTLYTFFSNGVTWSLGGNRAVAEAANNGDLPAVFAYEDKQRGTPVGAAVIFGIISTLVLFFYGLVAGNNQDLFWSLFAFSGVLFMMPYVAMTFAFVKLRKTNSPQKELFRIAGPRWFVNGLAYLCAVILTLTIGLFLYVPGEGLQWSVLIGSAALLILGEILMFASTKATSNN
ncbi:APC family permease [Kordiimonas aquimaris]|uniref:APC family permease n=1 Tax=Kordiimonas aquimaris TaxID=707591 RepID=UPI0021CF2838|nr:APC family permease [Kordiimonas aquimaris]